MVETTSHKAGSSAVLNITFEIEGKKYYNTGYSYLVTHPGMNPTEQGSTLVTLNLENGSSVNSDNFDATDLRFLSVVNFKLKTTGIVKKKKHNGRGVREDMYC